VVDTCPPLPWRSSPFAAISINIDREISTQAINQTVAGNPYQVIFTDAACKEGNLGTATTILNHSQQVKISIKIGVGSVKHYSIQAAEMIAIQYGIQLGFLVFAF
jgi:hypothetical protein